VLELEDELELLGDELELLDDELELLDELELDDEPVFSDASLASSASF
jgi:hypothetical protein